MGHISSEDDAEANAARQMRWLGYHDAEVTSRGADGGIDVRATGAAAQVKWRTAKTGRPDLQRLFGACSTEPHLQLLFFTASGYSSHAINYANVNRIALFLYLPDGAIEPINNAAENIVSRRGKKQRARQQPPVDRELTPDRLNRLIEKNRKRAAGRPRITQSKSASTATRPAEVNPTEFQEHSASDRTVETSTAAGRTARSAEASRLVEVARSAEIARLLEDLRSTEAARSTLAPRSTEAARLREARRFADRTADASTVAGRTARSAEASRLVEAADLPRKLPPRTSRQPSQWGYGVTFILAVAIGTCVVIAMAILLISAAML